MRTLTISSPPDFECSILARFVFTFSSVILRKLNFHKELLCPVPLRQRMTSRSLQSSLLVCCLSSRLKIPLLTRLFLSVASWIISPKLQREHVSPSWSGVSEATCSLWRVVCIPKVPEGESMPLPIAPQSAKPARIVCLRRQSPPFRFGRTFFELPIRPTGGWLEPDSYTMSSSIVPWSCIRLTGIKTVPVR